MPAKKKTGVAVAHKGQKTLRIKKKAPVKDKGKPPAPGERKAMRKRIVLSNTNALEVEGLRDLDVEMVDGLAGTVGPEDVGEAVGKETSGNGLHALMNAVSSQDGQGVAVEQPQRKLAGKELIGKVVGLKGETVDSLRAAEAFKITQGWGLFRRPGVLVREDTVVLSEKLAKAQNEKKALRLVLDGERGAGKSIMLLHGMATAFLKGWVVINIPEGRRCVVEYRSYMLMWYCSTRHHKRVNRLFSDTWNEPYTMGPKQLHHQPPYSNSQSQQSNLAKDGGHQKA